MLYHVANSLFSLCRFHKIFAYSLSSVLLVSFQYFHIHSDLKNIVYLIKLYKKSNRFFLLFIHHIICSSSLDSAGIKMICYFLQTSFFCFAIFEVYICHLLCFIMLVIYYCCWEDCFISKLFTHYAIQVILYFYFCTVYFSKIYIHLC